MKKKYIQYLRNITLILFAFGIVLAGYGAYQYYTTDQRINEIEDERRAVEEKLQSVDPEYLASVNPAPIAGKDIQLRRELNQKYIERDEGIKMAGIGIVLVALSWIIRDLGVTRRHAENITDELVQTS